MSLQPRRVVTGHDAHGNAIIVADDVVDNGTVRRPGHKSFVLWTTETVPADNTGDGLQADAAIAARSLPEGTVFRIVEYAPGVASAPHRTDSVDYAVVLAGEIDLVLQTETVRLRSGDTLIQRGTAHDWVNNGEAPCVIAFCLIGARPLPS
jgi:quercetin dioxygenase-like cupin family protein